MAIKKKSAKKKMTKEKPSQDAHWATLCDEYEEVQKNISAATRKAYLKGKLQVTHAAELIKAFEAIKKVKKKMKKFLKKHA